MPWSGEACERVLAALPEPERLILPALQRVQEVFGHIPDDALDLVAHALNVSRAEVYGVLTYYHDLRRTPPPPVTVRLCAAEACQAVGSRELRVAAHGLAADDVEVHDVYCLGNCALGPAALVNDRLVGRLDADRLAAVVAGARAEAVGA